MRQHRNYGRLSKKVASMLVLAGIAAISVTVVPLLITTKPQSQSVLAEASTGNRDARGVPLRAPRPKPELIDLSPFYNAALTDDKLGGLSGFDLAALPPGTWNLGNVDFDIRGLVQLTGRALAEHGSRNYPSAVTGISLNRNIARLHFLLATEWKESDGKIVGAFLINYADGKRQEFPLVYGEDLRDWCDQADPREASRAAVAWTGKNPATMRSGGFVRLFLVTRVNPRPDALVKSMDFVSHNTKSSPFLIAITVTDYSPDTPDFWILKANESRKQGNLSEAVATLDQGLQRWPDNVEFWSTKGELLQESKRWEESLQAFTKAIDLASADTNTFARVLTQAWLNRSGVLRRLDRPAEAGQDNCRWRGLPLRDLRVPPCLIDLSAFYNARLDKGWIPPLTLERVAGKCIQGLRPDTQSLGQVMFDARGLIQLLGRDLRDFRGGDFPQRVDGIRVQQSCRYLHFLHSTAWGVTDGEEIALYVVHFANGEKHEIPVVYGEDLRVWDFRGDLAGQATRGVVAWTGSNLFDRLHLFTSTWSNPLPRIEISSLDYLSMMTRSAPFLIAVTAETEGPVRQANMLTRKDRLDPDQPTYWLDQMKQLAKQGNFTGAVVAIEKAIQRAPESPTVWNTKGRLLATSNVLDGAYQSFTRAIHLASANTNRFQEALSEALLNRSRVMRRLGRWAEALADISGVDAEGSKLLRNWQNDHYYQRIKEPMPWTEAKEFCEHLGGHLATVTNKQENEFIHQHFARDHVCWLGGTDEGHERDWRWVTGEPFVYSNWFPGEPSNTKGEHFLVLGTKPGGVRYNFGLAWNNHDVLGLIGGEARIYPLCEWDTPPTNHPKFASAETPSEHGGANSPGGRPYRTSQPRPIKSE